MATIVDPEDIPGRGHYPWSEWFDGKTRKLTQGTDFMVGSASFATAVSAAARRHGLTVICVQRGPDVYLQATGKREAK